MSENNRQSFDDSLYRYDFDSAWDVEKALREPQSTYRSPAEQAPEHREEYRRVSGGRNSVPRERSEKTPPVSGTKAQNGRRKPPEKTNLRGWLILCALGLLAVLILAAFIWLIAAAVSPDEDTAESIAPTAMEITVPSEETQPPLSATMQLIDRADRLAAGYDYDGAVDVLREYGEGWEEQPELAAARERYMEEKDDLILWEDTAAIPHLAFHTLIADGTRAFRSRYAAEFNRNMVTVSEFRSILEALYNEGYVLVRLHDAAYYGADEEGDETYIPGSIRLPEGKTPLILSQDDVNYYEYMVDGDGDRYPDGNAAGFAHKIVIDDNGMPTCEYYDASGACLTGEYDFVPILESFIQAHPDFSYKGARGVLSVTGYQGVFGYRTNMEWEGILGEDAYSDEVRAAQNVAKVLKERGWEIAGHGYGHFSFSTMTPEEYSSDIKKWENQVQPIVGDSDIFMFPYGCDIEGTDYYSGEEYDLLQSAGYRYFCSFYGGSGFVQFDDDYFRMSRIPMTGESLFIGSGILGDLLETVILPDTARPALIAEIQ